MSDFNDFIDLVYTTRDKELLTDFLIAVTTLKERKEFAQRVDIVKLLVAGTPQLQIAKQLGVGTATVTRGSKELAQGRFKVLREVKGA